MNSDFDFCDPQSKATYKAGIYDWSAEFRPYFQMMNPSPPARFIVPGMNVGCMPYDALSTGTLECLFSSACVNSTAQWISNLPMADWPKPLDRSKLTKSQFNSTVASIVDQQMIDRWNNQVDFADYYRICAPTQCVYTFVGHENFLYIVTLLFGLFGGLNVTLRIMAPLIIEVARYIMQRFCGKKAESNSSHDEVQQSMFQKSFHSF